MTVGDMSLERFAGQLADEGVAIRWGPFVSRIVSKLPELAAPLHLLYADFPIGPRGGICDFHVSVRPRSLRLPGVEQQVEFLLNESRVLRPLPRRAALALFEWGLNWCVYSSAHQFLIIHAAVVEQDGLALLLPGQPGVGKSTLCAALVSDGWRLLSDELALLDPFAGSLRPIARPISLKNDSVAIVRRMMADAVFGPPTANTAKGTIAHMKPPPQSVRRADEIAWPRWIVAPGYSADGTLELAPVSKAQAFFMTADNAINYSILGATGFTAMCRLIETCDCYRLTHSDTGGATAALARLRRGWRRERHVA